MIRLGSLAGYPFEGPRALAGWSPSAVAAVYVVMYRPDPFSNDYAVIYVDHADDLTKEALPYRHPSFPCWNKRVQSKFDLHIATYEVPGGLRSHREQIVRELVAVYQPACNSDQYSQAWRREWIGEYQTPTTGPLTTEKDPRQ